jgi:hypothetical protein
LTDRVDDQLGYYGNTANKAQSSHVRIQTAIIIMGLLVPSGDQPVQPAQHRRAGE